MAGNRKKLLELLKMAGGKNRTGMPGNGWILLEMAVESWKQLKWLDMGDNWLKWLEQTCQMSFSLHHPRLRLKYFTTKKAKEKSNTKFTTKQRKKQKKLK